MATRVSELRNGVGAARGGLGTYADLDDRMLVLDFQAGNEGAFSEIHRRYSGLARHVCQRILRNAARHGFPTRRRGGSPTGCPSPDLEGRR